MQRDLENAERHVLEAIENVAAAVRRLPPDSHLRRAYDRCELSLPWETRVDLVLGRVARHELAWRRTLAALRRLAARRRAAA